MDPITPTSPSGKLRAASPMAYEVSGPVRVPVRGESEIRERLGIDVRLSATEIPFTFVVDCPDEHIEAVMALVDEIRSTGTEAVLRRDLPATLTQWRAFMAPRRALVEMLSAALSRPSANKRRFPEARRRQMVERREDIVAGLWVLSVGRTVVRPLGGLVREWSRADERTFRIRPTPSYTIEFIVSAQGA